MSIIDDAETELKVLKQYLVQCHLAPARLEMDDAVYDSFINICGKAVAFYSYRAYKNVDEEGCPLPNSPPESEHMRWTSKDVDSLNIVFDYESCKICAWTNRQFEDHIIVQGKHANSFESPIQGKPSGVLEQLHCAIIKFAHAL